MFLHDEDQATVITDTLATNPDGTPLNFTDKCVALPAMNLLVAATGYANLLDLWVSEIRQRVRARDITMLDEHAPVALRRMWAELEAEHGPAEGTSTIYHFGIEEESGVCRRIAYRSANNFESDVAVEGGFGVKPPPKRAWDSEDLSDAALTKLAERIRAEQDALQPGERIYIGGDLVLTQVSRKGIVSAVIHRFEDQYDSWQAMNGALPTGVRADLGQRFGGRTD